MATYGSANAGIGGTSKSTAERDAKSGGSFGGDGGGKGGGGELGAFDRAYDAIINGTDAEASAAIAEAQKVAGALGREYVDHIYNRTSQISGRLANFLNSIGGRAETGLPQGGESGTGQGGDFGRGRDIKGAVGQQVGSGAPKYPSQPTQPVSPPTQEKSLGKEGARKERKFRGASGTLLLSEQRGASSLLGA